MVSFITVTDKQKEYASQATMPTIASSNQGKDGKSSKDSTMRHVPTGMSYYAERRPSQIDDDDSDEELPVNLPAPFKKTRQEKQKAQNKVLSRLQGLMADLRQRETS